MAYGEPMGRMRTVAQIFHTSSKSEMVSFPRYGHILRGILRLGYILLNGLISQIRSHIEGRIGARRELLVSSNCQITDKSGIDQQLYLLESQSGTHKPTPVQVWYSQTYTSPSPVPTNLLQSR